MSTNLGKFVLEKKLGEGAMGEVWKAHDDELNRDVAIKFMKGMDEEQLARFRREAQMTAKLIHSNIASVYEVGVNDGRYYIAMQLIKGPTLKKLCYEGKGRLRGQHPKDVAGLIRDAARAIHHAHKHGVIHRDIKPDNLMVDSDPVEPGQSKMHLYVMDFGLARPMKGGMRLSVSGLIVGTPAYMSPEQARGEQVDGRADVYSLGATLYDLLMGHPPIEGLTIYDTLKKIEDADPKPMVRVDPDLKIIVMKCLEKDRKHRYQTAEELAKDLDRWLAGESILAHPPSITYRAKKFARKNRQMLLWLGISAVVCALAIVIGGITIANEKSKKEAELGKAELDKVEMTKKRDAEKRRADEETRKREEEKRLREEETKKTEEAKKQAEEEIRKQKVAKLLYDAQIASTGGRHEEAMAYYNELLRLDPKSVLGRQNRAILWMYRKELAKALDDAEEAVRLDQTNAEGWCIRGAVKANMGRWADAIPDYDRAIELNPARFNFWACRGDAKCNTGDRSGAVKDFEKTLEIAPRDWEHRKTYEGLLKKWSGK